MNFFTHVLHLLGSGATAYISARNLRDPLTRPNTLAGFQLAESGAVPYLEVLSQRAAKEGDAWLAQKLASHAADERRHGQIFAQALKNLNKQVIDFKNLPQPKEDSKQNKPKRSPFFATYFEGYDQESLKPENIAWQVFMASTYILELDASKDFATMARALPDDPHSTSLKKAMFGIAKDETGHAAYLRQAMERRLNYLAVTELTDEWRTRKVNAMVAMVSNLMGGGKTPSLVQDGVPTEMSEQVAPEQTSTQVIHS